MSSRRLAIALCATAPLLAGLSLLRAEDRDVARGNEAYRAGAFQEALARYDEAAARGTGSEALAQNRGAALYKLAEESEGGERRRRLEEAARHFERAARADDPQMRARARYNLGNTRYRQGRYADAAEAYKEVLRADPGHADARHNLALALRARDRAGDATGPANDAPRAAGDAVADAREEPATGGHEPTSSAGPDAGTGQAGERRDESARLPPRDRGDERRRRDRGPPSLGDVERKLDELERLSRDVWLERLRRRAEAAGGREAPH